MPDYGESSYRRYSRQNDWKLEELVAACSDALIRFACCYVKDTAIAEDLMEDAFTDLLMQKKKFGSHEQIQAYLYKAVRHRAIDYIRKYKKHVPLEDVENVLACEDVLGNIFKKKRDETL
jgi:RNA polymerase sigma-70 factor (ECF subfamily)